MLNRIIHFSLRFRGIILTLGCLLVGYGLFTAAHTNLDVFPEFAPPQVVIQTESPGLSPEEVESLVTRPIEISLNGTPALVTLRSESIQGLSAVTAVFNDNADIFRVRQMVSERLTEVAGHLPEGVKPPRMGPLTSSTSKMLAIGLNSKNRTPMELRTLADWTLRPRLLAVPGVAKVEVFGGEIRQLQIQVRPEKLIAYNMSLDEVLAASRKATAIRGAGFVDNANQRVVIRTKGQSLTAEQLGEVVLSYHGTMAVRLKDVAHVIDGAEPKFGDAQIMGETGVVLLVYSQYGANTMEVTRAVESALDEMKPLFAAEKLIVHPQLFRPANFIELSLRNIRTSLLIGGGLVLVVLLLFLLDLRTAFISFTAIPLSLLAAVIVLDRFGVSLNTLTLGGFAIAIGVVVDDAIIDVENILRRVRQNLTLPNPRPLFDVVLDASLEVRSAIVYATFIVALVFLPVLMMSGIQGKLFSPLAVAFILATMASLVVALTVTPALSLALLSRARPHEEPKYVVWLKGRHRSWLAALSKWPKAVMATAVVLFLAALAALPFFGGEFLPEFREGHYLMHMMTLPGTSLEESVRVGGLIARELLKNPRVRSVSQQAGRAENGEDTFGTHMSEFHVELNRVEGEEEEKVKEEIRKTLEQFPGINFRIMPFLAERIEETVSGATAQVVVNIFGDDLDMLDQKAAQVQETLAGIKGATDVQTESQPGSPELGVHLKPERLKQFGFEPVEVLDAIQTAYQGTEVGQVYKGNQVIDVTVILDQSSRREAEQIRTLLVRNAAGVRLPVRELAEVSLTTGRYVVVHEASHRRQQVTCNIEGRDSASFMEEAKKAIDEHVTFPAGVYPVYRGSAEAQGKAQQQLIINSLVAGVGIVMLLSVVFTNWRNLLLVLANLPFALVGGVIAVFLTDRSLSIGSLVGFVSLFGITMRNSIMLISHYEHLVEKEGMAWGLEAAIRGASERLLPITMTVLVTALGLLPLALGSGEAGREIEGPMAIVILGGLVTSTVLNLLVLPTFANRFGRFGTVPPTKAAEAPQVSETASPRSNVPRWRQFFTRKLTFRGAMAVLLVLVFASGGIYGGIVLVSNLVLRARVNAALPQIIESARRERRQLVDAIEAYRKQFAVYPPDHVVNRQPLIVDAVTNQLLYELSGTVYSAGAQTFSTPGREPLSVNWAQQIFSVDRFTNVVEKPLPIRRFLPADLTASREVHDSPDVNVLAFSSAPENISPEVLGEVGLSSWRYISSAPVHNTNRFDLWLEINVNGKSVMVGNWPGAE